MRLSEAVIAFSPKPFGVILVQGILAAALRRDTISIVISFLLIGRNPRQH